MLEEVLDIHGEINQMAAAMSNHRFAAARRLEEANKQNLKLFQRMMSEVLMLHRVKFQVQKLLRQELCAVLFDSLTRFLQSESD